MEIRKPPEGRSCDQAVTEDPAGCWRVGARRSYEVQTSPGAEEWLSVVSELTVRISKGKSPRPADVAGDVEDVVKEAAPGHATASGGGSLADLGVSYDDVPAETLHPAEVDDIYEEIQRPGRHDDCWSSSEFENYDEPSETEAAPPACRRKVQQLMKAASSGTRKGWQRTKLAMFRKVSFLKRKDSADEGKDHVDYVDVAVCELKHPPAQLRPPPEGLSGHQVVRRLILTSIVQSERNYLDSLQRILQVSLCLVEPVRCTAPSIMLDEYQRPLLDPPRSILNPKKVCQIFYRLQEIHQCHSMFQMALGSRVAEWDDHEKIGDLFVASFSKSMVLNVYSDYINNFSSAMALIKKACISKPAFLDFLKKKQASSPDRITLYGLMVKPIQRFPQFILLLQDMLKNTPRRHCDRLPLQLALAELETLAHKLNEQKRLADQEAEVRQLAGRDRAFNQLLLHSELLTETVYDEKGRVVKSKERKLFLLNDTLICVNVNSRGLTDISSLVPVGPKYTVKWCAPLLQVQVVEVGQDRVDPERKQSSSSTCFLGPARLYEELGALQHDLAVVEEVSALVATLSGTYQNLNSTVSLDWCRALQRLIRLKEEEIQNANRCRLSLALPGKPDRSGRPASVTVVFSTPSPLSKIHWVNWLHLAKIAQKKENRMGWESAEEEETQARPSTPLLICTLPLFSGAACELKAAVHTPSQSLLLGFCSVTTSLPQGYLWVIGGGSSPPGQVEIFSLNRSCPRLIKTVPLASPALCLNCVTEVREAEDVRSDAQTGNIISVGLQDGSVQVYSSVDTTVQCLRTLGKPGGCPVLCLQHFLSFLLAGLANGKVDVYQRSTGERLWDVDACRSLSLGSQSVRHLLTVEDSVWASCGNQVTIIQGMDLHTQSFRAHPDPGRSVRHMVCSGRGVWMAFSHSSSIQLFHTETLEALQDVNLSARTTPLSPGPVCVSSLLICQGLLWVGTNQGIVLTFPAPTLDGIPKITGKGRTSLNAHCGPVDFLASASSGLASSLFRRDSVTKGNEEEAVTVESSASPSQAASVGHREAGGVPLRYRLQSTCHLPGKLLTTQPERDSPRPAPVSPEHGPEDGSIYEVSEDPDVWVRGRPGDWGRGLEARRGRVTSIAIFSGGRGFRRVGQEVVTESCSDNEHTLLVWQLPLTVTEQ